MWKEYESGDNSIFAIGACKKNIVGTSQEIYYSADYIIFFTFLYNFF